MKKVETAVWTGSLGFPVDPSIYPWPLIQAISSYNVSWFELKETGQLE